MSLIFSAPARKAHQSPLGNTDNWMFVKKPETWITCDNQSQKMWLWNNEGRYADPDPGKNKSILKKIL